MRIAVRGFAGRRRVFEEIITLPDDFGMENIETITTRHMEKMAVYPEKMIEIEFLDDPGEDRFFRIGTDPSGMVMPIAVEWDESGKGTNEKAGRVSDEAGRILKRSRKHRHRRRRVRPRGML